MVNTSFTIQKEVPVTSNSELIPLIKIATLEHLHPIIRKLFTKSIPNVLLAGRLPYFITAWEKIIQNQEILSIVKGYEIPFVAREIQYFELAIFSFNSYVYYLTRSFIASTRTFNLPICTFGLPTCAFNLATRVFSVPARRVELVTLRFELVSCRFELVTRRFELVNRRFEHVTRGFELVTRVLLFHRMQVCQKVPSCTSSMKW